MHSLEDCEWLGSRLRLYHDREKRDISDRISEAMGWSSSLHPSNSKHPFYHLVEHYGQKAQADEIDKLNEAGRLFREEFYDR
ncbi:MAG: hypothetical protein IPK68_22335 [Bdellovibrionales bacterium]|nr:hypothetical protein [Bdellovibrionales bacterium]